MRRRTKAAAVIVTCCIFLCACAGGAKGTENQMTSAIQGEEQRVIVGNIPCKFPLVDKETTLHFMIAGYQDVDANDVYVLNL